MQSSAPEETQPLNVDTATEEYEEKDEDYEMTLASREWVGLLGPS